MIEHGKHTVVVSPRLARPIKLKDRAPLATLDDALAYLAALSGPMAQHKAWERAAELGRDACRSPTRERVTALARQIEHALFVTARCDREQAAGTAAMPPYFDSALKSAHEKNIARYQGLLESSLTEHDRRFVERRVAEEQAALTRILRKNQPLAVA